MTLDNGLIVNDIVVKVQSVMLLGLYIAESLSWQFHKNHISRILQKKLYSKQSKKFLKLPINATFTYFSHIP